LNIVTNLEHKINTDFEKINSNRINKIQQNERSINDIEMTNNNPKLQNTTELHQKFKDFQINFYNDLIQNQYDKDTNIEGSNLNLSNNIDESKNNSFNSKKVLSEINLNKVIQLKNDNK